MAEATDGKPAGQRIEGVVEDLPQRRDEPQHLLRTRTDLGGRRHQPRDLRQELHDQVLRQPGGRQARGDQAGQRGDVDRPAKDGGLVGHGKVVFAVRKVGMEQLGCARSCRDADLVASVAAHHRAAGDLVAVRVEDEHDRTFHRRAGRGDTADHRRPRSTAVRAAAAATAGRQHQAGRDSHLRAQPRWAAAQAGTPRNRGRPRDPRQTMAHGWPPACDTAGLVTSAGGPHSRTGCGADVRNRDTCSGGCITKRERASRLRAAAAGRASQCRARLAPPAVSWVGWSICRTSTVRYRSKTTSSP